MKIAITGKGGVGKTTFSSILSRMFAEDGYRVVAVDAEKNALLIKGSVPGANKSLVTIRSAVKFTKNVPAAKTLVDYSAKAE